MGGGRTEPHIQRLTAGQAAERLRVSTEAIRGRIRRGTIRYERVGGRVYVLLPEERPTDQAADQSELIEALRDQIEDLRRQRDEWREQARVVDRLLSAAMERIPPQLEAPQEPQESSEPVEEEPERAEPRSVAVESQESVQRPWWRRVFGR